MKSYIHYLYLLDLMANENNPITRSSEKEDQLYEDLIKRLSGEDFTLFKEFINEYGERNAAECELYFEKGFRFAMRLMIECFNNDDIKESV